MRGPGNQNSTTHGMRNSRLYRSVWTAMKQRCHNPNAKDFARYGGRGITVCDRWRDDFMAFYADMGDPPSKQHTLERRDNALGYSPENCCWALPLAQTRNRRCTVTLTHAGETLTLMEWARRIGIGYITLHARITRYGMSIEQALTTPVRRKIA